MQDGYWQRALVNRISRRRALVAGGTLGASAAFLAACGGSDSSSGSPTSDKPADKSSLITKPADTTAQAKRTGIIKDRIHADVATLDSSVGISALNAMTSHTSSTLVQFKPGFLKPSENEIIPDIAESWEWSPDGLTVAMKIRQGVKWHNKAPVNGRALDMDDILFSWNRFAAKGASRAAVANSADPGAPVLSMTATDSRTLTIKLKEPIVYALGLLASTVTGNLIIVPKETETGFDPRSNLIGTGPYVLTEYKTSQGFTFRRNPDYWDKDAALAEQIDMPIVTEYATTLAQVKAGNLYSFSSYNTAPKITPEDVVPVKRETPGINVYQSELNNPQGLGVRILIFGWQPNGKSNFLDERVRQAISMSIDRDLFNETFYNISKFGKDGLPVDARWNSALLGQYEGWWIDPKDEKAFGPNAKYFKHDVAEAKKLLAAAGFPNGFETVSNYVTSSDLPTTKLAEVIDAMITDIGIKAKVNPLDYQTVYVPKFRNGKGQFEGWGYKSNAGGATGNDPIGVLANEYWSKVGVTFHGFSTSGQNDVSGDPMVDQLLEKGRIERDTNKRKAIVVELQKYLAKPMYAIEPPGQATGFNVAWPALANFNVFQQSRQNYKMWVDDTKEPLKK